MDKPVEKVVTNDKETNTTEPKKKEIISAIKKKELCAKFKCTSIYLDTYMKQIVAIQNSGTEINPYTSFPLPMFELIVKHDGYKKEHIDIIEKGMPLNFHVLYAEAEIFKSIISD